MLVASLSREQVPPLGMGPGGESWCQTPPVWLCQQEGGRWGWLWAYRVKLFCKTATGKLTVPRG